MITSSDGRSGVRLLGAAVLVAIPRASGLDQIEIPVAPAHQDRYAIAFRIAVDQVVGALFHFEDSFLQGHGLMAFMVVHAKDPALGFGLRRRGRLGSLRGGRLLSRRAL